MNADFTRATLHCANRNGLGIVRAISEDRHTGEFLVIAQDDFGDNWRVALTVPGIGMEFYDLKEFDSEDEAYLYFAQQHTGKDLTK